MVRIALLALLVLAASPCAAQYPDRNVTFLANFPPGGLVDIVTRVVAEGMKPKFPHGISVVNKPGAGGAVGVSDLILAKQRDGAVGRTKLNFDAPRVTFEEVKH